jgi:soluble lytic murein transglycosylase
LEAPPPETPLGARYEASDLTPYFMNGKAAQAKAEFDRGHFAKAAALLEAEGSALPVRYLRALSLFRAEHYERAAQEMSDLAQDYPVLRDRCLVHGGVAHEELQHWAVAARLFAQVPRGSKLFGDARLGAARALRRLGDWDGAIGALSGLAEQPPPAWGRDLGAEALMAVADLHRAQKKIQQERETLVRLWSKHPLSALSLQAEGRLKSAKLGLEPQVTRGEQLIEAHRNRQGLSLLGPHLPKLKLPDPLACRAHFAFGKAQRKERQYLKAIHSLAPVVAQCKDPDLRARALYVLGSARSIADVARGAEPYEQLAREFPNHSFADDALFFAADVHLKNGNPERALKLLSELANRYPGGDFAAEALFKSFWIRRSRGEQEASLALLDRLERGSEKVGDSYEQERARYWRARSLEAMGQKSDAIPILEALVLDHPATYYGLMARARLGQINKSAAEKVAAQIQISFDPAPPWPLFAGVMGEDPHFQAAIELLRLGFVESVPAELLAVNRVPLSESALRLLVEVLTRAGDTRSAHAVARVSLRKELSGRITPQNLFVWQIAYPNAFRDPIERHCRTADVDPHLLLALIREESALDPKAFSWAGALGLSQLMLPTARSLAGSLKIQKVTAESLLEPDQNIRLGSWYLGTLLKRFQGNKALALAAYNAGPLPVERWQTDRAPAELDEWIEAIPISQTRGYVKRVLRSYNTYKLLYARSAPLQTVSRSGPW